MHVPQSLPIPRCEAVKPTLPRGMERDGFVALVDAVARSLGIGAAAMMTFRTMIASTRPSAFKCRIDEPCCYLSQNEIAHKRGVTACRIRQHEAALVRAGLIEKRTMANGARSGFSGCGVFFGAARDCTGYHVRFREVARGGLRVVLPANMEAYAAESRRHFNE